MNQSAFYILLARRISTASSYRQCCGLVPVVIIVFAYTKVYEYRLATVSQHNIVRLNIQVQYIVPVNIVKRISNSPNNIYRLLLCKPPHIHDIILQGDAVYVLHTIVGRTIFLKYIIHAYNACM